MPLLYAGATKLSDAECRERGMALLGQVGLADKAAQRPRELTQIEQRKLELARAMAAGPRLLIADESMAGLSLAAREKLDNLVFVVNCNLQRLDGPVRGNGSTRSSTSCCACTGRA